METIKNIAAVIGCISAAIALIVTIIKPIRKGIACWVTKVSKTNEQEDEISLVYDKIDELSKRIEKLTEDDCCFKKEILESMSSLKKGVGISLGNIIGNIYNKYKKDRVLPQKEYEVMCAIFEIYSKDLHMDGLIEKLYNEMTSSDWHVELENK